MSNHNYNYVTNSCLVLTLSAGTTIANAALNDTGITTCSNETQDNLPCPVAGYPGQDAEYGSNGFDFTKLDAAGNALPVTATNHSCVKDNVTGLIWEVKTDDGGLRDKDWTYTWYDSNSTDGNLGTVSGGTCATTGRCDTEKFVADVNAQGLCGHNDWRMPNPQELVSIVDYSIPFYPVQSPPIDTELFPNSLTNLFWTSSPAAVNASYSWVVSFEDGRFSYYDRYFSYAVRLVRAGAVTFSSFLDNGDSTVTDQTTGLMWAKCSVGQSGNNCETVGATSMTWAVALTMASNSTLAGYSDWRLPNVKELPSLVDYTKFPMINSNFFPNIPPSYFWTSSPVAGADTFALGFSWGSWFVNSYNGDVYYNPRNLSNAARLVRAGQWLLHFVLSVAKAGNGAGTVTSSPVGINCSGSTGSLSDCSENYVNAPAVTLIAAPAANSNFAGWSGACSGTSTTCTVTVDADKSATATFNLQPPSAVTNVATNLTQTNASLNGSVTSAAATATVSFDFGTTTSYGTNIAANPATVYSATPVAVTASKTGLTCNSIYHYRIKAVNSIGTSAGADQIFTTAICPPTAPTAITTPASGITASSAILNGAVISSSAAATASFDLGTTTAYGTNIAAIPTTINGSGAVTATKTGLLCNTNYNYRVKAVNSVGTSYGSNVIFKTLTCPKTPHALIIGGRTTADDALSSMLLSRTLTRVYSALKAQGFRDSRDGPYDEIRLLGNGLTVTLPSGATIAAQPVAVSDFAAGTTLTQWASSGERLVIYLVGHGNPGVFYLDQVTTTLFSATALDAWLDLVQPQLPSTSSGSGDIALVYEACYSGSFLPVLTAPNRMLFASAAADQRAFFANNGLISYSYSFWSEIEMGSNLKQAQQKSSLDMEMQPGNPQTPQLEANGNATANESGDLQLAAGRCLGFRLNGNQVVRNCTVSAMSLPVIATVATELTVSSARSANLWLTVDLLEADTIQAAWVAITRPDFQTDSTLAFDQVPIINLVRDANFEEKWVGRYAPGDKNAAGEIQRGLDVAGKYDLAYYVMQYNGMISTLKPSAITQTQGLAPGTIAPALYDATLGQLSLPVAQLWNGGNSRVQFTRNNAGLFNLSAISATNIAVTNPPRWNVGSTGSPSVVNIPQLIQAGDTQIYRGTLKRENATGTQSQWTFSLTIANFICGDANNNGVVNIVDALAVARSVVNLLPPPTVTTEMADVDSNGFIAIADALNIAKFAVGLAVTETCLD